MAEFKASFDVMRVEIRQKTARPENRPGGK
jgi:hypothetical protein